MVCNMKWQKVRLKIACNIRTRELGSTQWRNKKFYRGKPICLRQIRYLQHSNSWLCLWKKKVAISKHRSVDVCNTLFGKVKLDPVCIACDRPFGPTSQVRYYIIWHHTIRGSARGIMQFPPTIAWVYLRFSVSHVPIVLRKLFNHIGVVADRT